jgi:hypothetical protein
MTNLSKPLKEKIQATDTSQSLKQIPKSDVYPSKPPLRGSLFIKTLCNSPNGRVGGAWTRSKAVLLGYVA